MGSDGEGPNKRVTRHVICGPDDAAYCKSDKAFGTSPLVKSTFYGGDADCGRIVAASGRAGDDLNPQTMSLWFAAEDDEEGLLLFAQGMPTHYDEAEATELVKAPEVVVTLDCGAGSGAATVWTCNLSPHSVSSNEHYRT